MDQARFQAHELMKMHGLIFGEEFKASHRISLKYFNTLDTGGKKKTQLQYIRLCQLIFSPHSRKIIGEKHLIHFLKIDTKQDPVGLLGTKVFLCCLFLNYRK